MFAGRYCHIASFFTTKCHKNDIAFLAANKAEDGTGDIAQVLLGEPHVTGSESTRRASVRANEGTPFWGYLGSARLADSNWLSCG